jgi:hypothetical protein
MQIGVSAQSKHAKGIKEGRDEDGSTANAKQARDQARKDASPRHSRNKNQ